MSEIYYKDTLIQIYKRLLAYYGRQKTALEFEDVYQLTIMVVLSAQESDAKINKVAKTFFKKFPTCKSLAEADLSEIEEALKQVGLYRQKARYIKQLCTIVQDKYNGVIPDNIDDLLKLPGIGRKSANAILAYGFDKPAIVVDRHFIRIINRLGIFGQLENPDKIEQIVAKYLQQRYWSQFSLLMQAHGRTICLARKPKCNICPISEYCQYAKERTI